MLEIHWLKERIFVDTLNVTQWQMGCKFTIILVCFGIIFIIPLLSINHDCFKCVWELIVLVPEMFFLWPCPTNHISLLLYPRLKDKNIFPNIALSRNRNKTNFSLLRAHKSLFIVEFYNIRHNYLSSSSLQGSSCYSQNPVSGIELLS